MPLSSHKELGGNMQTASYIQCSMGNNLREMYRCSGDLGAWEQFWYRREMEPPTGNKPAHPFCLLEPTRWQPRVNGVHGFAKA